MRALSIGLLILSACGLGDSGGDPGPVFHRFTWSWALVNDATQQPVSCEKVGVHHVGIAFKDAQGTITPFESLCVQQGTQTTTPLLAGRYSIAAACLNKDKQPVLASTFEGDNLDGDKDLGKVLFSFR